MITKIRQFLTKNNLDALLITRNDSFLGEYYPPESQHFLKATGFSGSAGLAIITQTDKILFVDSRYTEQAKIESDFQVFEVPTMTTPSAWIEQNLPNKKIGYSPSHRSILWLEYMLKKHVHLFPVSNWNTLFPVKKMEQPKIFDYGISYSGETTESKLNRVATFLKEKKLDGYILTSPESVSYLLNKRSLWISEYPVVFKRLIVMVDQTYMDYNEGKKLLFGKRIGIDFAQTPISLQQELDKKVNLINCEDPISNMRAVKNQIEQDNIRKACLFESLVICRFLAWIEKNKATITEMDCDQKLKRLRSKSPLYRGDSFDTIAAVGKHAALAHYRADQKSDTPLSASPILLVDTGGNYLNGTTDMTRTIAVGMPTEVMKKRYTQVLKGHIALATHHLKQGDTPKELDQKAHAFLRADGVDFGHSTGHGIGMYLAVHEYPPAIAERDTTPLRAGMLFSNEPAFYDINSGYGIRLENMIMTQNGPEDSLILENLLWIPFDPRLIDFNLLTKEEKQWLKAYHQGIQIRIFPDLSISEQRLLKPLLDIFNAL